MKSLDFNNYLFRCSQLGKIMTGISPSLTGKQRETLSGLLEKVKQGNITEKQIITLGELLKKRNEKPQLSKTIETYLFDIHKSYFLSRNYILSNKYTEKGIRVEEKSITLYSEVKGKLFIKNKKHFQNKFIQGTPDNEQKKVRDIKSSWSFQTFPLYVDEVPNKDYYLQLQGYMDLTGHNESELIYCLIDTPINIIDDELRRLDWKQGVFDINGEVREERIPLVVETIQNMIYTQKGLEEYCQHSTAVYKEWFTDFIEIPKELRIKSYDIQKDKETIESLYEQIIICRERLNKITQELAIKLNIIV